MLIHFSKFIKHVLGCASISRALTGHIDKPLGYPMRTFFENNFPMNVSFLAPYPDLFSFTSIIMLTSKCYIKYNIKYLCLNKET